MAAMDEKIRYWLEIAEYDLATAEADDGKVSLCRFHVPSGD